MWLNRFVLASAVCVVVAGCAPMQPMFNLPPLDMSSPAGINIVDERPAIEKQGEILSLSATNVEYGIHRVGDDKTVPDRIAYLKQALFNQLGDRIAGKTITVKSFVIYRNSQAKLRGSNPFGGGLMSAFEKHANKEQPGGYDQNENPEGQNAAVINLKVALDGKEYATRAIKFATSTAMQPGGTPEAWEKAIGPAMQEAVSQLANQIAADYPK